MTASLMVHALEEGEIEVVVGGGVLQLLHRTDALLLQQRKDLRLRHALGDGDGGDHAVGGGGAHAGDQGPVVHVGVELIGARGDLGPLLAGLAGDVGEGAEELEDHLIFDEPLLLQFVCHLGHAVPLVDLHDGGERLLVQGQHVVGPDPAHAGQQGGDAQHADDVDEHAPSAQPLFPAAARGGTALLLVLGGGHPLPALAASVLGRAAALVPILFLRH